jgi:hypothetical protein
MQVFAWFEVCALKLATLSRRFGINYVRELYREEARGSIGPEGYKFSNTHSPYIARELIEKHPHLSQFIRIKSLS